jgi:TonB family protein
MRYIPLFGTVTVALVACAMSGQIEPDPMPALDRASLCHREALDYQATLGTLGYPREQLVRGQGGWVVVGYDLDGSGSAKNLRGEKASPPGMFDSAVLEVYSKLRFKADVRQENCRGFVRFQVN